ncbi:MAG TPA: alpha-galactosidase, partial [Alphaproteobacteria bacterium]|nr:alpha-galactosidase [Alphaproteobacteria bacterium]
MAQRWYYLESGQTGLLIDVAPGADAFPAIRHFGLSLGSALDAEALHALTPQPLWGARLDQPKPLCVLPGLQSGEFCAAAVAPAGPGTWRFDAAQFDQTAKGARLRLHFQRHDPGRGRLTQIFQAFGDSGVIGARILAEEWQDPILWAAALAIPLPGAITDAITFGGDWAREFAACRQTLGPGGLLLESYRGRPGHDRFPGLILGEAGLGEDRGLGVALTLGWSGNARMRIDALRLGGFVAQLGELMLDGDEAYEVYESPWAYVAVRNDGLNGIAEVMQRFVRSRIIPNLARARPRPVHFNTWEAVYFAQNDETLRDLAERAAFVGAERFVLDDGWFKGRDNDRSALGDWSPDPAKYPDGLFPLIEHVRSLGLEFGLWVEPEMVSPDSDLARQHPGWLRREPDGSIVLQRHQAVLDLSIPAVCDHVYDTISGLLATHPIAYFKWDMNRDLTGLDAEGRPGHADYVRALYDLIERVRQAHPAVEIEACASGGGRCDYGL